MILYRKSLRLKRSSQHHTLKVTVNFLISDVLKEGNYSIPLSVQEEQVCLNVVMNKMPLSSVITLILSVRCKLKNANQYNKSIMRDITRLSKTDNIAYYSVLS